MESTAVLVQNDYPIDELQAKLMDAREPKEVSNDTEKEAGAPKETKQKVKEAAPAVEGRKMTFRKGEQVFEIDEDAEIEFMADKRPTKLTLRDLKDRAAGDIAVKNRMHALAEEKKKVNATFVNFAKIAKDDPLGALEYISEKAKEADSEFEHNKYLEMLADQADRLGKMDEKERKAHDLEKKLAKANQDLSQKEREQNVVLRKQEILSVYPEIGDQRFDEMVDAVLENPDLLADCETESDVMDTVEHLIEETLAQRDIMQAIESIDPSEANNDELIYAISDQLKQNPDLEKEDLEEIVREVLGEPVRRSAPRVAQLERPAPKNARHREERYEDRQEAIERLSEKQRSTVPRSQLRAQGSSDFHLLMNELQKKKQEEQSQKKMSNKLRR